MSYMFALHARGIVCALYAVFCAPYAYALCADLAFMLMPCVQISRGSCALYAVLCAPYAYALCADLASKLRLRHTAVLHGDAHMEMPHFEADLPRVQAMSRKRERVRASDRE